jgi:hypothetical protein
MLVLSVTAGFAFLLADTLLEHRDILSKDAVGLIPVVFSAIALLAGIVAVVRWKEPVIKFMHYVLIASVFVGLVGLYFHVKEEDDDEEKKPAATQQQGKEEEKEKEKSPLAPLSFAGLAAIGLLGTSRRWQAEVPGIDKAAGRDRTGAGKNRL